MRVYGDNYNKTYGYNNVYYIIIHMYAAYMCVIIRFMTTASRKSPRELKYSWRKTEIMRSGIFTETINSSRDGVMVFSQLGLLSIKFDFSAEYCIFFPSFPPPPEIFMPMTVLPIIAIKKRFRADLGKPVR